MFSLVVEPWFGIHIGAWFVALALRLPKRTLPACVGFGLGRSSQVEAEAVSKKMASQILRHLKA